MKKRPKYAPGQRVRRQGTHQWGTAIAWPEDAVKDLILLHASHLRVQLDHPDGEEKIKYWPLDEIRMTDDDADRTLPAVEEDDVILTEEPAERADD